MFMGGIYLSLRGELFEVIRGNVIWYLYRGGNSVYVENFIIFRLEGFCFSGVE